MEESGIEHQTSMPDSPQQNTVVVVSGESVRHGYFTAKGLDLTEGFKILSGAVRIHILLLLRLAQ